MKNTYIIISLIITIISIIYLTNNDNKTQNTNDYVVFIAATTTTTKGSYAQYYSKYHRAGCDYILGKPKKVSLTNAKENGYSACPQCNPEIYNLDKFQIEESTSKILFNNLLKYAVMIYSFLIFPILIIFIFDYKFSILQIRGLFILNSIIISIIINQVFNIEYVFLIFLGFICFLVNMCIYSIANNNEVPDTKIN